MVSKNQPKKLSWATLLSILVGILPILLKALNEDTSSDEDTTIFVRFDRVTGKFRISVLTPSGEVFTKTRKEI